MARLNAEFAGKNDWFVNVWQPDVVQDSQGGKKPFAEMDEKTLATDPACWILRPAQPGTASANWRRITVSWTRSRSR